MQQQDISTKQSGERDHGSQITAETETMKNQHLEKNFKLRLVKYFLFCSLSLLMIQGM